MIPGLAYGQTAAHSGRFSCEHFRRWTQLDALREALLRTQQQVAAQQQEIQVLKTQLKGGQSGNAGGALISAAEVVRPNPAPPSANPSDVSPEIHPGVVNSVTRSADQQTQQAEQKAAAGSIKLGDAVLTPGGFVDFENIFRTTNTQSNIATNFAGIPFSNTAQGMSPNSAARRSSPASTLRSKTISEALTSLAMSRAISAATALPTSIKA